MPVLQENISRECNIMTRHSHGNSKLRILISGHLPPLLGGIATYYQSLMDSSLPQKVDLCFVQTSPQTRKGAQSGLFSFSNLIWSLKDIGRFAEAVIKHHPQLSHIATADGLSFAKHGVCVIIARLFGSRVLLHPHCGFSILYTDQPRWWQWFFRRIIHLTNGVVTLSREWDQLISIVPGCPVYYLPNAIDLTAYRAISSEHREVAKSSTQLRALYLGYLGQAKGSFDIIEAAKEIVSRHMPVIFDLVGEELKKGDVIQLQNQIDQAGLGSVVTLHPVATGSRKVEIFCDADIFIFPSYSEGMPIAVIEAMACGLPIIATRVGGVPEMVSDGVNGILIDPGRPDQIVGALQHLYENPDMRHSMKMNSYKTAFEKFDIEKLVPRLVSIYSKVLTGTA